MRILVVSDTHGDEGTLERVILSQPLAEIVVHCGDGASETEHLRSRYPDKMFICVRGNCDFCSDKDWDEIFTANGKRIFVTHGHNYGVKGGLYRLSLKARQESADIVLFGHTHQAFTCYEDGLYMMNPGSLRGYDASYGFVDIENNGIVTNIVSVYSR